MVQIKIKLDSNVQNYQFWASKHPPPLRWTHNQHLLKMMKKNGKNDQNSNFHKVAGNEIGHKKNFPKCSPSPGDTFWYPACVNTPIRTTIIISQTLVKIEKFSKVKFHRNFSAVNSLEKNSQNFSKKIQKIWKIIFFFKCFDFLST